MVGKPINLLDDIGKVIYSELREKYLAFKLRDMKKQENKFDHLILVLNDRELFADFVIDYAEKEEDEVIFESNEEFSILVNSSPQWFSFDDLERCKNVQNSLKNLEMSGFLEFKQQDTMNILKTLFSKKSLWESRYVTIQGSKLYVYKDQKYNKPQHVIDLTGDIQINEVRKAEMNGKDNVIQIVVGKQKTPHYFAASTYQTYTKWLKALKHIKDAFLLSKLKEKEKFKYEIISGTINKQRAKMAFGIDHSQLVDNEQEGETEEFDMGDLFSTEKTTLQSNVQNKLQTEIKNLTTKLALPKNTKNFDKVRMSTVQEENDTFRESMSGTTSIRSAKQSRSSQGNDLNLYSTAERESLKHKTTEKKPEQIKEEEEQEEHNNSFITANNSEYSV